MSPGLVHCLVSVIVSRQMNPTSGCPCPPEPPVQDTDPVASTDTFLPPLLAAPSSLLPFIATVLALTPVVLVLFGVFFHD